VTSINISDEKQFWHANYYSTDDTKNIDYKKTNASMKIVSFFPVLCDVRFDYSIYLTGVFLSTFPTWPLIFVSGRELTSCLNKNSFKILRHFILKQGFQAMAKILIEFYKTIFDFGFTALFCKVSIFHLYLHTAFCQL
jgi:hypothetical protein